MKAASWAEQRILCLTFNRLILEWRYREILILLTKRCTIESDFCDIYARHPRFHVQCLYFPDEKWICWEMWYSLFVWFIQGVYHKTLGAWTINNSKHILQDKSMLTLYQQTHWLKKTETLSSSHSILLKKNLGKQTGFAKCPGRKNTPDCARIKGPQQECPAANHS